MKRKELMAIVALAAGLTAGVAATTDANAGSRVQEERGNSNIARSFGYGRFDVDVDFYVRHPGHFIGRGHFHHGNGFGWGHHHHDHDIY